MRRDLRGLFVASTGAVTSALLGAVVTKLVALYGGPSGVALYSQFRQMAHWFVTIGTFHGHGSIAYGVANSTSMPLDRFLSTVATLYALGTLVVSAALLIWAAPVADLLLGNTSRDVILAVRLCAGGMLVGAVFSFCMGLLLGHGAVGALVSIQIAGGIAATALAYPLAVNSQPWAYVSLFIATYGTSSIAGVWIISRRGLLPKLRLLMDVHCLRSHIAYAATTLGIVLLTAGAFLTVRAVCIKTLGLESTGLIEAAFTISGLFAHVFLVPIENYWFSRLTEQSRTRAPATSVYDAFRLTTIGAVAGVTFAIIFRNFLIAMFYTREFEAAGDLLRLMLIGDFFRITGWVLRVCLLARGDKRGALLSEALVSLALVIPISLYVGADWIVVAWSYLAANVAWFVFVVLRLRRISGISPSAECWFTWLAGLATVLIVSYLSWDDAFQGFLEAALIWFLIATAFLGFVVLSGRLGSSVREAVKGSDVL